MKLQWKRYNACTCIRRKLVFQRHMGLSSLFRPRDITVFKTIWIINTHRFTAIPLGWQQQFFCCPLLSHHIIPLLPATCILPTMLTLLGLDWPVFSHKSLYLFCHTPLDPWTDPEDCYPSFFSSPPTRVMSKNNPSNNG